MKIVKLEAEGFKRIKAIEIVANGESVILSGKNAQGKSSVLDAIMATLAGKFGSVERPVHEGETRARVVVTMEDIVVTRKWTLTGSTVEVTPRDGSSKFTAPQKMLDSMIGRLSFDPLSFAEAPKNKQREALLSVADLDFDPDANARARREAYDRRTEFNRFVKEWTAEAAALEEQFDDETPDTEPDVQALSAELIDAQSAVSRHADLLRQKAALKAEWEALKARAAAITAEVEEINTTLGNMDAAERRPIEAITADLESAQAVTKKVVAKQRHAEVTDRATQMAADSAALTREIERLDAEKTNGLAKARLPVNELGFDDEGVLYKGVPFEQASAAERLLVSIAMAMAMNPDLRVILIRDASLLDSENLALIERVARDRDYQLWIETVHDAGKAAVVIEDGQVRPPTT